jgi:hypothetical protein
VICYQKHGRQFLLCIEVHFGLKLPILANANLQMEKTQRGSGFLPISDIQPLTNHEGQFRPARSQIRLQIDCRTRKNSLLSYANIILCNDLPRQIEINFITFATTEQ